MAAQILKNIGIVVKPSAWLYNDDKSGHTDELFMGWAVGVMEQENGWLNVVTHYGYRGYLREEDIRFAGREELCSREQKESALFLNRDFADVMEQPNVRSRILCTLCKGAFFTGHQEISNGYRKITLSDGRKGYVPQIACGCRRENDGYLYSGMPNGYFLNQDDAFRCTESDFRQQIISHAIRYLGAQYRWAGKSPAGIDCSGLSFMCYLMSGRIIYRDAKIMPGYPVQKIPLRHIKPGDLLYFPGHIAIYLGDGRYIHATGNEKNFGCVRNSLFKKDPDYRKDLADSLLMAGGMWG